jgi:hypothetical protein
MKDNKLFLFAGWFLLLLGIVPLVLIQFTDRLNEPMAYFMSPLFIIFGVLVVLAGKNKI